MYLLASMLNCADPNLTPLWKVVGTVVDVIWIGIPIALIVFASIDLGKAVISSDEKKVETAKKSAIRRLIYAVSIFAVVWIVTFIFDQVSNLGLNGADTSSWKACWQQIRK